MGKMFWVTILPGLKGDQMRNDPFSAPQSALYRSSNHELATSTPKIDCLFKPITSTGVPLGGIGTGGITRSCDGRFSRWTIKGGGVKAFDMPANGFVLRVKQEGSSPQARSLQPPPSSGELESFDFETILPEWNGLFPLAWHKHEAIDDIVPECMSFSPVIAGDLQSSTLPVAVFRWRLRNRGQSPAEVSLGFHFANLNGWFNDFQEGRPGRVEAGCFNHSMATDLGQGIILDRRRVDKIPSEGTGEWGIAVRDESDLILSKTLCFDGTGDGHEFWNHFLQYGDAPDLGEGWLSESGFRETPPGHPTAAVSARTTLSPGEERTLTMTMVWDLPEITFGQGRKWYRYYTREWGKTGRNAQKLTELAFNSVDIWESQISEWHDSIASQLGQEPHRAGVAINESYFLVDGLTIFAIPEDSQDQQAHFGIIECHDYALYNTLDLWIYAAEAVANFFPELAASVASDYAMHLQENDTSLRRHRWDKNLFPVNPQDACPHDLGGPGEDPFFTANSYTYRDATIWKDLNCDLILCLYREGKAMGIEWRTTRFPAVKAAIEFLQVFDRDDDGLIENEGIPDQTFDNIPMLGASSYCGGLWIAALLAGSKLAREAGEHNLSEQWNSMAKKAIQAYNDSLFTGYWYRVDTQGHFSEACFIEQLFGPFLARRLGLGDIVPQENACKALKSIFERNFLDEGGGEGVVSLAEIPPAAIAKLPHQDDTSFQTKEIQPGFNFSFAAQLEEWGLLDEAEQLRKTLYHQLYVRRNLVFQTPAAYDKGQLTCRAILNMRPLAAWWMKR
ncbi:MAG: hypothetical protein F4073_01710 [Rhodobacteraceae bacterium]|nr:hypothetical protein [Paracoccaceae bacterium]MYF45419.1 hypothetical protein [Paracoccaceae bacterium]MYI90651.1 hypothetical protein [Paracoccaceae bacterium]